MQSIHNRAIVACAGAGETTMLVREALRNDDRRIAFLTYTNSNAREIRRKFELLNCGVPSHVDIFTWYSFLLPECVRPYQRAKYSNKRIRSVHFQEGQSARFVPESNTKKHYFAGGELIYSDKAAKFVLECERATGGAVTSRVSEVYTDLYIDEFQDLAGWDFDLVEVLLRSGIRITLVGDPRQSIFSTHSAKKNSAIAGHGLVHLIESWESQGLCRIEYLNDSYRLCDSLCKFANLLWPNLPEMNSLSSSSDSDSHVGVFLVSKKLIEDYVEKFSPQILRYSISANTFGYEAMNFGVAKGRQFKRTLIVPTDGIKKFLSTGRISYIEKSLCKFHVAITRAQTSVAFLYDGTSSVVPQRYSAESTPEGSLGGSPHPQPDRRFSNPIGRSG